MEFIHDKDGQHTFEIVKSVPKNYFIWNIGTNMTDNYLPLCEWLHPEDPNNYSINPNTLKAIKCDGAQTILKAIGGGQDTIEKMERYIKRYSNSKRELTRIRVKRMRKALEVLQTIQFD